MNESPEFAEQYTRAEKVRFLVLGVLAGGATVLVSNGWLIPAIASFAADAECRDVFGVSGLQVLSYGLFLGMPLLSALVVGLTLGRRGYRILRDGRSPPVGEKTFRPTPIVRGRKARVPGYVQLLSPLPFLAIAAWGVPQAHRLSAMSLGNPPNCAARHSVNRTPGELRPPAPPGLGVVQAITSNVGRQEAS